MKKAYNLCAILMMIALVLMTTACPGAVKKYNVTLEKGTHVADNDFEITYQKGDSAAGVKKGNAVTVKALVDGIKVNDEALAKNASKEIIVNVDIVIKITREAVSAEEICSVTIEKTVNVLNSDFEIIYGGGDTASSVKKGSTVTVKALIDNLKVNNELLAKNTSKEIIVNANIIITITKETPAYTIPRLIMAVANKANEVELTFSKKLKGETVEPKVFNVTIVGGIAHGEPQTVLISLDKVTLIYTKDIIEKGKEITVDYNAFQLETLLPKKLICEDGSEIPDTNNFFVINNFGKDNSAITNKTELSILLADVISLRAGVKVSIDGTDILTSERWATKAALDSIDLAISGAEAVYKDGDVTQERVNTEVTNLTTAKNNFKPAQGTKEEITTGDKYKLTWNNTAGFYDGSVSGFKTENGEVYTSGQEIFAGTIVEFTVTAEGYSSPSDTKSHFITLKTSSGEAELLVDGAKINISTEKGFTVNGYKGFGNQYRNTKKVKLTLNSNTELVITGGYANEVKPVINTTANNETVEVSNVKNLPEPAATATDDEDGNVPAVCEIKSSIGGTEIAEENWAAAIAKTYAAGDKITVTFTATDSAWNSSIRIITYTVIADPTGAQFKLECTGHNVTERTGSVKFYTATVETDQWGNNTYIKGDVYTPDTEVTDGTYIYIEVIAKKTNTFGESDGPGWITFTSTEEIKVEGDKGKFTQVKFSITSAGYKITGGEGTYGQDTKEWFAFKLDKNVSLAVTSKEPK